MRDKKGDAHSEDCTCNSCYTSWKNKRPDFKQIEKIYDLSRKNGVNFTMVFNEYDTSFNFEIFSPAPSECFITKNHSFEISVELVLDWLQRL